jgi:F-type H+-transporting ATPase subunit delta
MLRGKFELNIEQSYLDAKLSGTETQLEDEFFSFYKLLRDSYEFKLFLEDPRISAEYKMKCVREMCPDGISAEFLSTIFMLIENGREELVEEISKGLTKRLSKEKNVMYGEVFTVAEVPQKMRAGLQKAMQRVYRTAVVLRYSIEPQVLGGVCVKLVNGEAWDLSLKHKLEDLRATMSLE